MYTHKNTQSGLLSSPGRSTGNDIISKADLIIAASGWKSCWYFMIIAMLSKNDTGFNLAGISPQYVDYTLVKWIQTSQFIAHLKQIRLYCVLILHM